MAEVDGDLARKSTELSSTNLADKATAAASYNPIIQEDKSSDDKQEGPFGASTMVVAKG